MDRVGAVGAGAHVVAAVVGLAVPEVAGADAGGEAITKGGDGRVLGEALGQGPCEGGPCEEEAGNESLGDHVVAVYSHGLLSRWDSWPMLLF